MRGQTFLGLLLVAALGMGLAWLFRRCGSPAPEATPTTATAPSPLVSDSSRGQIVPLMVGEGFSGTAFIGVTQRSDDSEQQIAAADPPAVRLQHPVIRKSDAEPTSPGRPQLSSDFPHAWRLLGIQADAESSPEKSVTPSPIAPEYGAAFDGDLEPVLPQESETPAQIQVPQTHRIVDGDTLPRLAESYFQDAGRADEIFQLNRDRLPSFDLLPIGVEINLPTP